MHSVAIIGAGYVGLVTGVCRLLSAYRYIAMI
jgi:UDP-glucose 6-dehydrogenase